MNKEWLNRQILYRKVPLGAIKWIDRVRHLFRIRHRYPLAAPSGQLSCSPLIIVSAGRSGTTLLRSMLVAGDQIAIPPETQVFPLAIRRFLSLNYLGWADLSRFVLGLFPGHSLFKLWQVDLSPLFYEVTQLSGRQRTLATIVDMVFCRYRDEHFSEALLWGDQSPINTLFLDWIYQLFPNGRYLHLVRDGRDAISSMVKTGWVDLPRATTRWTSSVEKALKLGRILPEAQFMQVRYEELVTSPEPTLRRIAKFLDIQYTDRMLEYWRLPTTLEGKHIHSHENLNRPVFSSSIGKWRSRLSSEQQIYVNKHVKVHLKQLEYEQK